MRAWARARVRVRVRVGCASYPAHRAASRTWWRRWRRRARARAAVTTDPRIRTRRATTPPAPSRRARARAEASRDCDASFPLRGANQAAAARCAFSAVPRVTALRVHRKVENTRLPIFGRVRSFLPPAARCAGSTSRDARNRRECTWWRRRLRLAPRLRPPVTTAIRARRPARPLARCRSAARPYRSAPSTLPRSSASSRRCSTAAGSCAPALRTAARHHSATTHTHRGHARPIPTRPPTHARPAGLEAAHPTPTLAQPLTRASHSN